MSQILLKNSFGKVGFQIFAEVEMVTPNENGPFGRHFETIFFLLLECDCF